MFSGAPMRVARLALIVGLVGLAMGAFVIFPLSLLSLHAEASLSSFEDQYQKRGDERENPSEDEEPTPAPSASPDVSPSPEIAASPSASPTPTPSPQPAKNDRALAWKAARMTARALTPAFAFVGVAALIVGASSVRKLVQK